MEFASLNSLFYALFSTAKEGKSSLVASLLILLGFGGIREFFPCPPYALDILFSFSGFLYSASGGTPCLD
jgi:hypothetical protein